MNSYKFNSKWRLTSWAWVLGMALAMSLCSGGVHAADEASPTLRRIRESGVISLGYREASLPFAYLDAQQKPVGFSVDLCLHLVDTVRRHLDLARLERRWVPVNAATRIPLVTSGQVDLECGASTNTLERQRTVAFSLTTFVAASRLLSRQSAPVSSVADLRGASVVSTVGTTNLQHLRRLRDVDGLAMTVIAVKDDSEAFRLVETERAKAYAMDDVLLHGLVASASRPQDFHISQEALSVEPYGLMLRRGDPAFKALVDGALTEMFRSGAFERLYQRWFLSPIPPQGINLQLPMSPSLRRLLTQPTDSGRASDYAP